MNLKEEIEKLDKNLTASVGEECIEVGHKDFLFDYDFERLENDEDTLAKIKDFISIKYDVGKSIQKKDYFEVVVGISNYYMYGGFDEEPKIEVTNVDGQDLHFSIGDISEDFEKFLRETIHWDNFSPEYFSSLKIFNADLVLKIEENKLDYSEIYSQLIQNIFFDLHHKYGLQIDLIDLSDEEKYETYYWDEEELGPIETTKISFGEYDFDLVSYYNRASNMSKSEFQYLAYFQVLECIFDEVYKFETIQDVKGILQANWFSKSSNENIDSLIGIVDRYNKDKNDRNKTKLVLEKYFKGDLHDEAYYLVNKEIIEVLIEIKQIKKEEELKDLQKIANIIYDFRCECTHSNRSYPIKHTTIISNDNLEQYITLIRKIAERIILNYRG